MDNCFACLLCSFNEPHLRFNLTLSPYLDHKAM